MSRSRSDCLFISEPRIFEFIPPLWRRQAAFSDVQLSFTRVAGVARDPPVIGGPPGERAAERRDHRVNRVTPTVSHHYAAVRVGDLRSEEHTSELQSLRHLVCRLL